MSHLVETLGTAPCKPTSFPPGGLAHMKIANREDRTLKGKIALKQIRNGKYVKVSSTDISP